MLIEPEAPTPAITTDPSATTAIGHVQGPARVIRADGRISDAKAGDALMPGDIIETDGAATVAIPLGNGTVLHVGDAARLLIKDVGESGDVRLVPLTGRFALTTASDRTAPDAGATMIETPDGMLTLARGSLLVSRVDGDGLRFVLLANKDGSIGEVLFENEDHVVAVDTPYQLYRVADATAAPAFEGSVGCSGLAAGFGAVGDLAAGLCAPMATAGSEEFGDAAFDVALAGNISPGGDEAALPGDAIDVTAETDRFDLSPDAAPLSDAPTAPVSDGSSATISAGDHRTEEALFLNPTPLATAADGTVSLPEPLVLRAFDPGRNWEGLGRVDEFEGRVPERPLESTRVLEARQGAMAQLEASDVSPLQIETFLGLGAGQLAPALGGAQPSTGAAIKALSSVSLDAGESVRFDVFFDAATVRPFDETAVFTVATRNGTDAVPIGSVSEVGDVDASGWQRVQFTAGSADQYTFGFAILNDQNSAGLSRLYVDNVAATESPAFSFATVATDTEVAGGTVTRSAPAPSAIDDRYTVSEEALFTTDATNGPLANDLDPDAFDAMRLVGLVSTGTVGRVTLAAGNTISYDPRGRLDALAVGETLDDVATYIVDGGNGITARATVTFVVEGVNDAPIARPDTARMRFADGPIDVSVTANDTDVDSDDTSATLNVVSAVAASGADVRFDGLPTGDIRYDPSTVARFQALSEDETATDTITYTVRDRHGAEASSTVNVLVRGSDVGPDDPDDPEPPRPTLTTDEDTQLSLDPARVLEAAFGIDAAQNLTLVAVDGDGAAGAVVFGDAGVTYDPRGRLNGLNAGDEARESLSVIAVDGIGDAVVGRVTVTVVGVNDTPIAVDDAVRTDENRPITVDVRANDRDVDDGLLDVVAVDTSGTRGAVTINEDGTLTYDPFGAFDALGAGEQATDSFGYTVRDADGGIDTATVRVSIDGLNDTERPVDSFERDLSALERTSSFARTVTEYREADGGQGFFQPTDGTRMVEMEARGSTVPRLESFLGLGEGELPRDSDGSAPAFGSAIRLSVDVAAGDRLSFDWMFDARDAVNASADGLSDNDFAVLTIRGSDGTEVFTLSDVRQVGDRGASGFRTSIFTAPKADTLVVGIGVINDRTGEISGPEAENSFLLVDNVRVNADLGGGYQVVDSSANSSFQTVVQETV